MEKGKISAQQHWGAEYQAGIASRVSQASLSACMRRVFSADLAAIGAQFPSLPQS